MSWNGLFDCITKEPPASEQEIALLQDSVLASLTESEIAEINAGQQNPFPPSDPLHGHDRPFDPSLWHLPRRRFPESFVDFLRWSNGGEFARGDRLLQMFRVRGLRDHLLAYHIPESMPGAVPFGFDGAGGFYHFDMRNPPVDGEYPIVLVHSGNLGWDEDDLQIAQTFAELIATA